MKFIFLIYIVLLICVCIGQVTIPTTKKFNTIRRHAVGRQIINGLRAKEAQFPYQVLIQMYSFAIHDVSYCGGSIIAPRWILTAAHCCNPSNMKTLYSIGMGSINKTRPIIQLNSTSCIMHSGFNDDTMRNDIALIHLDDTIPYNSKLIKPIALPTKSLENETFVDAKVVISGFGYTNDTGKVLPETLKYGVLRIMNNKECDDIFEEGVVTTASICGISYSKNNQSTCKGDSGGPIVYMMGDKFIQVGIVSYGSNDGCDKAPSVGLRVTSYLSWIANVTKIPFY